MKIICPQCQFTRQVPKDKMPKASTMATCPQCQCRFQVHIEAENKAEQTATPLSTTTQMPSSAGEAAQKTAQNSGSEPVDAPQAITKYSPPTASEAESFKEAQAKAHEAYAKEQEAAQAEHKEYEEDAAFAAFAIDNPWENPERAGYFSSFYQTALRVLFAGPRFFAGLMPEGSQKRALIFFVIVGVLQISFERFWGGVISDALAPTAADDPQLQLMLTMLTPQSSYSLALLLGAALNIVEIFFSTTIYYLIFRFIAPDRAYFNLIFQVVAYSSAPMLLCLVPALGSVVGFVWGIACTAVGCRYAMRLTWGQTLLGILPLYLIGIPLIIQFLWSV